MLDIHPLAANPFEQLWREMQACRWSCHRTGFACIDRLIRTRILWELLDVRGDLHARHGTECFTGVRITGELDLSITVVIAFEQVQTHVRCHCTGFTDVQTLEGAYQSLKSCRRAPPRQQDINGGASGIFAAAEARFVDTRIVDDHNVVSVQIGEKVSKLSVFDDTCGTIDNHETREVPLFKGFLSDQLLRQLVVEIPYIHY
jgi:hypothetical protein